MSDDTKGKTFQIVLTGLEDSQARYMTLRQYAAIKLKVPDSGEEWLDNMIRQSLRDDFAAKAMLGALSNSNCQLSPSREVPEIAYRIASQMFKAREA